MYSTQIHLGMYMKNSRRVKKEHHTIYVKEKTVNHIEEDRSKSYKYLVSVKNKAPLVTSKYMVVFFLVANIFLGFFYFKSLSNSINLHFNENKTLSSENSIEIESNTIEGKDIEKNKVGCNDT